MRTLPMISNMLLLGSAAVMTASAASFAVTIPAAVATPWVARFLTNKKMAEPDCNGQVVTARRNNFVCAKPGIDWQSYSRVVVGSVDISGSGLKKPLTGRQAEQLRQALANSLQRQFGASTDESGRALMIHATITGVERNNRIANAFGLAAVQAPVSFGGATTTFQLMDEDSGETLAEMTLHGRGRLYDAISGLKTAGHARKAVGRMPRQVGRNLETLRTKFSIAPEASSAGTPVHGLWPPDFHAHP
jgi:Protein of unknown function (DUF3313)